MRIEWTLLNAIVCLHLLGFMSFVDGNNGRSNRLQKMHKLESGRKTLTSKKNTGIRGFPFGCPFYTRPSVSESSERIYSELLPPSTRELLESYRVSIRSPDIHSRIQKLPLRKHFNFHFSDLPEWRSETRGDSSGVSGVVSISGFEPSSHGITQTDREYFNIVRTENGVSGFFRFTKDGSSHKLGRRNRPKFIYHRVPASAATSFLSSENLAAQKKDVAAVSLAPAGISS